MRKFFELLYFGAYYFEWMTDRMVRRILRPIMRPLYVLMMHILPFAKRNLAKRGLTPKQHVNDTMKLCDKLADSNYGHTLEWHIYPKFTLLYTFAYFDIMWILRMIFGSDWGIIQINGANGGIILTVIGALAMFSASRMEATVGQDKIIKKYRRKSKSVHRKALALFLGCCALVLLGFYFLFLRR
ncbi:MAG: hypothetical protein IJY03_00415 [Prevotella sp.]|nr:hypothetical protein [Prevotella sp.]